MRSDRIMCRSSIFFLLNFTLSHLVYFLLLSNKVCFVKAFIIKGSYKFSKGLIQETKMITSLNTQTKDNINYLSNKYFSFGQPSINTPFFSRHTSPCFISLNIELDEDEHDEEEESFEWINEDFVNPQNIVEGSTVKILTDEKFFHVPKLNKLHPEGFTCKDLVAKVMKICIENKDGVICSANRPVIVKFEEPVKFTAHFGFSELDLIE